LVRALAHERYDWAEELLAAGADATMKGDPAMGLITSSALGFAVSTDRIDLVQRILEQGGSVSELYSMETTPLQNAIQFDGSTEVVQLLLDEGADPNAVGNFLTMLDATFDQEKRTIRMDAFELLLQHGADPEASQGWGGSPLLAAALVGSPRAIKLLIQKGADPNRVVIMHDAEISMLYDDPVQLDIFKTGITPLAMASMMGNIGAATTLIEAGAATDYVVSGDTGEYTLRDLADIAGVTIPGI
jgi:ankyrin repeat protein